MLLSLSFAQKVCLIGFALIFGTWGIALVAKTTSIPLTVLFFVGMLCVTYSLCENVNIPK